MLTGTTLPSILGLDGGKVVPQLVIFGAGLSVVFPLTSQPGQFVVAERQTFWFDVMSDRWVIVDDTISSINYIGDSWFADVGSQDATDNGPPFLSTLHGTNTSASLAFNFTGRSYVNFDCIAN